MDWKVTVALGLLVVALLVGLVICVVTSVNSYARRFAEGREDTRRGFEVKTTTTTTADGTQPPAQSEEKDDHHG
jgi:hypothetical protein